MNGEGRWVKAVHALAIIFFSISLVGCGGGSGSGTKPPVPVIQNLNSSTSPSSPVGLPIEINGTGFQSTPGQVTFTQGNITETVTPSAGGWSDTGIVAVVPSGNGSNLFTVPGTLSVSVTTTGGTSNAENLALVQTYSFNVNNITWTTTTPLPTPMSGLRAVAVPSDSAGSAFVVVTGGYDGTKNNTTVLVDTIAADGTLGLDWGAIITNPLPASRAHHGMVEADPGNSLVPVGSRFIYVIGGQENAADIPGGTTTVFMAPVNPATGEVGLWTPLASTLPVALVGPGVTLMNGYIYVIGGLQQNGEPSPGVYSAKVNSDGTLGSWTKSTFSYPSNLSFPSVVGFAGHLYVFNGDDQNQTDPNFADNGGVSDANFATAHFGEVGNWVSTNQTVKNRSKQIAWLKFGQIIDAEGIYSGNPGSLEMERTTVNPDSTLAAWAGVTSAVNQPGANLYNAAAIVSPLLSSTNAPRFLLLGGEKYVTVNAGYPVNPLSATVYVNNNTTP
jgi:hypothetical protein